MSGILHFMIFNYILRFTLNEPVTLTIPTQIKGKYSGATGFLVNAVSNSTSLVVYEKNGEFVTK